jgi:uncharacterized protein involved in type VI secretion and phage assembly
MAPPALAPTITIDGSPLADKWQDALLECKVDSQLCGPGQVTLRFSDPGYALVASRSVRLGTKVVVSVFHGGPLITAEVTTVGVEQRLGENPELLLTALDKSHRMARGTRIKTYLNTTYANVVSELAASHGLSVSADATDLTMDYVLQVSSDLAFLSELAARIGFCWWVDGEVLHFKSPEVTEGVELKLGDQLHSFSVHASGHAPSAAEVRGWDRNRQQKLSSTSKGRRARTNSALAEQVSQPDRVFGASKLVTAALAGQSQVEVDHLSDALFDWATSSTVRAIGVGPVSARIRPGNAVKVKGAGPLSGTYPVQRAEHTYRPGQAFLTRFWSGGHPFGTDLAAPHPPLQGPATRHSTGLVVGEVTSVNDPEQAGRVKVRFPGLDESQESAWSRVLSVGGGDNRGSVVLPEVGDEVLVGFEHGDPRQPVILGGLHGARLKIPNWPVKEGKVVSRRFTSRTGHLVEISDGEQPSEQHFMVQLADREHTLKMSAEETFLSIPSGQALRVQAGETQVSFSKTGDITIKGQNVTIEAQQQFKLTAAEVDASARTALQLEGQGQASLKGGALALESDGPATLKGAIVQIN